MVAVPSTTASASAAASSSSSSKSPKQQKKKKRDTTNAMRKAPQAPKRFKSSYICFFTSKQSEIKEELGKDATVEKVSKRSAEMWKQITPEERRYWDDVASKDKERYMLEKSLYTGPWQVPYKRAKVCWKNKQTNKQTHYYQVVGGFILHSPSL